MVTYNQFGKNWVACFISDYPELESARKNCIEAARIKDVSRERLIQWFDDYNVSLRKMILRLETYTI